MSTERNKELSDSEILLNKNNKCLFSYAHIYFMKKTTFVTSNLFPSGFFFSYKNNQTKEKIALNEIFLFKGFW